MKRFLPVLAIVLGSVAAVCSAAPVPRTTLRAVHALTNEQASKTLLVDFEATVTYIRSSERTVFVQDDGLGIYVMPQRDFHVRVGDRVLIHGVTHDSFRPIVEAYGMDVLAHGVHIAPLPANFDDLIHARFDCLLVSVRGVVRSADLQSVAGAQVSRLQMVADGGNILVVVDSYDAAILNSLLDAEVEVTGAASGDFDGKMHQTGVVLHVPDLSFLRILHPAAASPWSRPLTPMDEILTSYHVVDRTQRVRVEGAITYYQPGSAMVLQHGPQSLWIQTQALGDFHIGDEVDATGFPEVRDGFLTLARGEIRDHHTQAPVSPKPNTPRELAYSHNVFDLVSLEGQVVTEVRENSQDEYVLVADGYRFSAIIPHAHLTDSDEIGRAPMKPIPVGAKVRVSGICILEDSNPFNAQVPFDILMRSFDDISVVAKPSLMNTRNLIVVVSILWLVVFVVSGWGWTLRRKVKSQTAALAKRIEAEAAQERRLAQLEQRRSSILEHINGKTPLVDILQEIAEMASIHLDGAPCWCETADHGLQGRLPFQQDRLRIESVEIPAHSGPPLGRFFAGLDPASAPSPHESDALDLAAHLATLAMETRQLYSDLHHRSEFDQLTGIHNRFSLEKHLDAHLKEARQKNHVFGLVYIDLDKFKQINDLYGHRVGDLYLQEVSQRMKHQLRSEDTLARLGGDEFVALVPVSNGRPGVEEVALRLEHSFDRPFELDGKVFSGSASIGIALYPENADSKDGLLKAADMAMYLKKNAKRDTPATLPGD